MAGDELTELVDRLRRDRRRHPYHGRREYSRTARELADACGRLVEQGQAAVACPVLRKAVDRMTAALMYMDDSSGIVGDDLREIMNLYARACAAAPPNPRSLAAWLVKLECDGPGWPRIVLRDFAAALGPRGLSEIERLVAERAQTAEPESWTARFAVRDLREQLAEVSGDVDRYVSVLAEHLASAVQYERIVRALRDAGRLDDALDWARRGLAEKAGWPHSDRLRDTLVELLLDAGDLPAAMTVRRTEFDRHPTAAAYRSLVATAARAEAADPTPWALGLLRDRAARQPAYLSELINVLMATNHDEEAWRTGAQHTEHIGTQQWLALLERRQATHPAEVIGPYQQLVERQVLNSADKQRYRRAVTLLCSLRDAHLAVGDPEGFSSYLRDLRVQHKRRPTFLATLDGAGL